MGTAVLGTGSPPEVLRYVASNAQRWCVEIDGRPGRLASWTEPGLQALSWHFPVGLLEVRPESALTDCEGHFVPVELDIFE